VQTVDFITPIVDDPYAFGQIAAANSLSDVYAMGGRPLTALNIAGFPADALPISILSQILRGGSDMVAEARATVVGGHTIDDREPKYGLAVTGLVHPDRIWRNSSGRGGDRLILTKAIGTGIVATAIKRGAASPAVVADAVGSMRTLNRAAATAAAEVGPHACTDVTGFGLLGHLFEMTIASKLGAKISWRRVPVFEGVWDLVRAGMVPGGTRRNLEYVSASVDFASTVPPEARLVLADAQTSGGLLIAVAPEKSGALLTALRRQGVVAAVEIGELRRDGSPRIEVVD